MAARYEILRGIPVSAAAAGAVGMLAALLMGLNPLGGLSIFPFTLFGALAVLLPTYLWFKDLRKALRRECYMAVGAAGGLGGWFMLTAITGFHGVTLGFLGALFGVSTASCWIGAHYLTRRRSHVI